MKEHQRVMNPGRLVNQANTSQFELRAYGLMYGPLDYQRRIRRFASVLLSKWALAPHTIAKLSIQHLDAGYTKNVMVFWLDA